MTKINRLLYKLFYKTLCPRPDYGCCPQDLIKSKWFNKYVVEWWYNLSGKIASHFHKKYCSICKESK